MNRDYAGFLTQNITGFRNQTGGKDPIGATQTGCTMQNAENFNPNVTEDDGSCLWQTIYGDSQGCQSWSSELGYHLLLGNTSGQTYATQCLLVTYGCTDPEAQNYNPSADQDWTLGEATNTLLDENAGGQTLCNYITDAKGKKGERFPFRRFGGNEYGFSSSGFQSNGFTKGAPTSQPYAASFANACGCGA
jgi:hypothetical protein